MALTAPTALVTKDLTHPREIPAWGAAILAVAGNILIVGIIATAAAAVLVAAALIFGTALFHQL